MSPARKLDEHLAHDGVQLCDGSPRMLRGGHQGGSVDRTDLLLPDVGREPGRNLGIASNNVSRFLGTPSTS